MGPKVGAGARGATVRGQAGLRDGLPVPGYPRLLKKTQQGWEGDAPEKQLAALLAPHPRRYGSPAQQTALGRRGQGLWPLQAIALKGAARPAAAHA